MINARFDIVPDNCANISALSHASVAVLGMARSGIALAGLLARHGSRVLLSDIRARRGDDQQWIDSLPSTVMLEFGGHSAEALAADLICISPGIPRSIPLLREAIGRKTPVIGEIEVGAWFCKSPIVAITGSNGKTTTTRLSCEVLRAGGKQVVMAGNIGIPLAAQVDSAKTADVTVLELSSFQLESIVNFHPSIAVLMNLSPNHLDRYKNYDDYIDAKLQILKNMGPDDLLIYNADDQLLGNRIGKAAALRIPFSIERELQQGAFWQENRIIVRWGGEEHRITLHKTALRGPHNRYNMAVAALIGVLHQIAARDIERSIESFKGIEHRLEFVCERNQIAYYNDSKATTVASLGYALQSFEKQIVLIAGGVDKGGDFGSLRPLLEKKGRAGILIGQAAGKIAAAWDGALPVIIAGSLADAVEEAQKRARSGDIVLLAPACSSFDMFTDYEDRGNQFKTLVRNT